MINRPRISRNHLALVGSVLAVMITAGATAVIPAAFHAPHTTPSATATAVAGPATQLTGKVQPPGNGKPAPVPLGIDGCDHNYADASGNRNNICVPLAAPLGKPTTCTYLKQLHIGRLKVIGADRLRLTGTGKSAPRGSLVC
jgi:hypothetical protein